MNQLAVIAIHHAPAIIAAAGDRAAYRFLEFFTAQIRNPNRRRAYVRSVGEFGIWIEQQGIPSITDVSSVHVATYRRRQWQTMPRPGRRSFTTDAAMRFRSMRSNML